MYILIFTFHIKWIVFSCFLILYLYHLPPLLIIPDRDPHWKSWHSIDRSLLVTEGQLLSHDQSWILEPLPSPLHRTSHAHRKDLPSLISDHQNGCSLLCPFCFLNFYHLCLLVFEFFVLEDMATFPIGIETILVIFDPNGAPLLIFLIITPSYPIWTYSLCAAITSA